MILDDTPEVQPLLDRIPDEWPRFLDISSGRAPLPVALDQELALIAPRYTLHQCRSKYGSLAFYAQAADDPYTHNDAFDEAFRVAERRSAEICELCGKPRQFIVAQLWAWTLCEEHSRQPLDDARSSES